MPVVAGKGPAPRPRWCLFRTPRAQEPVMPLSHLPALVASAFCALARRLDPRSARRLPAILVGLLFAKGRRTVTSWLRAAGIGADFRRAYTTVSACGRRAPLQAALAVLPVAQNLVEGDRLTVA